MNQFEAETVSHIFNKNAYKALKTILTFQIMLFNIRLRVVPKIKLTTAIL